MATSNMVETGQALDEHLVRQKAYELWQMRGCPTGSPEQDWYEALRLLRTETKAGRETERTTAEPSDPAQATAGDTRQLSRASSEFEPMRYVVESTSKNRTAASDPPPTASHRPGRGRRN